MMILDICPSPALYPFYREENDIVIVTDVFRASATICTILQQGAAAVIPVADIETAQRYRANGYLTGAERHARKCDFADFGNSPFDYSREAVEGKEVVFTTTNGTQAIEVASGSSALFIGTFCNMDALLRTCLKRSGRIVILCAGWNNRTNLEDTLFGGAFAEQLSRQGEVTFGSDNVRIALQLWQAASANPLEYLKQSDHYHRLIAAGVADDAPFCLQQNSISVVPYYEKREKKIKALPD